MGHLDAAVAAANEARQACSRQLQTVAALQQQLQTRVGSLRAQATANLQQQRQLAGLMSSDSDDGWSKPTASDPASLFEGSDEQPESEPESEKPESEKPVEQDLPEQTESEEVLAEQPVEQDLSDQPAVQDLAEQPPRRFKFLGVRPRAVPDKYDKDDSSPRPSKAPRMTEF